MTATRRRPNRLRIAFLAMVMLLQSLAAVLPAAAGQSMHAHAGASSAAVRPPCNMEEMAGQAMPPCCDDDDSGSTCGEPGQCTGDCGLLRTAALPSNTLFDPPSLLHETQSTAVRRVDLRPRPVTPGLRPPISA